MKINIFRPAFLLLFISCSLFVPVEETETLTVELPVWPPEDSFRELYPPLSRWLVHIEGTGLVEGNIENSSSRSFFTTESTFTLTVQKNAPLAITAQPLTLYEESETVFFLPAGLTYPVRKSRLTWEGGFLASALQKLIQSKAETGITDGHMLAFLSRFNWKKAQDSIDSKITAAFQAQFSQPDSQKNFYNPWYIGSEEFLEAVSYGNFSSSFLNNTGCMSIDTTQSKPILSSFILENEFIARTQTVLIKKEVPNLFYTPNFSNTKECAIIIRCDSAKNLSLTLCNLPIFIEEKTTYEENRATLHSGRICPYDTAGFLRKKAGSENTRPPD